MNENEYNNKLEIDFPAQADTDQVMKISLDELEKLIISIEANTQLLLGEYELDDKEIKSINKNINISLINARQIIEAGKIFLSKK